MVKGRCINKHRDKNGNILGYDVILSDNQGNTRQGQYASAELKALILNNMVHMTNLTLTSDGRLISKDDTDKKTSGTSDRKVDTPISANKAEYINRLPETEEDLMQFYPSNADLKAAGIKNPYIYMDIYRRMLPNIQVVKDGIRNNKDLTINDYIRAMHIKDMEEETRLRNAELDAEEERINKLIKDWYSNFTFDAIKAVVDSLMTSNKLVQCGFKFLQADMADKPGYSNDKVYDRYVSMLRCGLIGNEEIIVFTYRDADRLARADMITLDEYFDMCMSKPVNLRRLNAEAKNYAEFNMEAYTNANMLKHDEIEDLIRRRIEIEAYSIATKAICNSIKPDIEDLASRVAALRLDTTVDSLGTFDHKVALEKEVHELKMHIIEQYESIKRTAIVRMDAPLRESELRLHTRRYRELLSGLYNVYTLIHSKEPETSMTGHTLRELRDKEDGYVNFLLQNCDKSRIIPFVDSEYQVLLRRDDIDGVGYGYANKTYEVIQKKEDPLTKLLGMFNRQSNK